MTLLPDRSNVAAAMDIRSAPNTALKKPALWLGGLEADKIQWVKSQGVGIDLAADLAHASHAIYGDKFLEALERDYPENSASERTIALCLSQECTESYVQLLQLRVRNIIYPGVAFDTEALRLACRPRRPLTADGSAFLSTDSSQLSSQRHFAIAVANDVEGIVEIAKSFMRHSGFPERQSDGAALLVKEAVTNCIYHSFRRAGSHERKYNPGQFSRFYDGDAVQVVLGLGPDYAIIRVSDNAGSLGPLSVGNSLDRQRSEKGLLDSRGRGFYFMYHLADRLVITVERGVSTGLELYFIRDGGAIRPNLVTDKRRHFELLEY